MKQVEYINRYGDHIQFKEIDKNTIEMAGFEHYRYGGDFIDPSGGPYIRVGTDVGRYFDDGKVRRVKEFDFKDGKILLIIQ